MKCFTLSGGANIQFIHNLLYFRILEQIKNDNYNIVFVSIVRPLNLLRVGRQKVHELTEGGSGNAMATMKIRGLKISVWCPF